MYQITLQDFEAFKRELVQELQSTLQKNQNQEPPKYLRSADVMQLLGVSHGTLQTMRNNGTIPFSKIGGSILYSREDIDNLFEANKFTSNTYSI